MSESWHVGRVTQVSGLSVHAARFHGRKGLLKAPVRSEGRFPLYLLGLTLGSFTVGFNGSHPRWTEAYVESKHAQVEHELQRIHPGRVSEVIIAAGFGVPPNPTRGALTTPAPHRVVQPALTELSAEAEPLRSGFNRDASSTRLLLILSPS